MDEDGSREEPLGRLVAVAGHLATQRWSQLLAERYRLTPAGMRVLLVLDREGEITHRLLADRCFIRPGTLTGVVDTLEKAGYVRRERGDGDRRAVRLALTEVGAAHAREIIALTHRSRPLTSVDADPARAAVIRQFLLELISNLSRERTSDEPRG
ncbi:MarR family winged helix-turn-helix transcriptional regulator [Micromonospora sp. NPDC049679]|uniref:MarR family winged helix-turn-helix transcriptional regulator n=1 Tax=Micromonospora sp. NPDC049679 TaxID=3155920 RepID=UPI0033E5F9AD